MRVDLERVLVVEAVVEERRGEVVRGTDRMVVAGEMEVEVLHRDDLRVAAARGSALDPEDRAQGRLADRHRGAPADLVQALRETDRRGRLALPEGRRADRRDDDVLAVRPLRLESADRGQTDLRLRGPIELGLVGPKAELRGHLQDRPRRDGPGDLQVARESGGLGHGRLAAIVPAVSSAARTATPAAAARAPPSRRDAARRGAPPSRPASRRAWAVAARRRCVMSRAFVTGPTPPGTGVSA